MFDKLKNTIKAEAQKEAQKLKKALEDTKNGVKGAKEKAKEISEDMAKNLAVAPILPLLPAMMYMLKKEKGLTYSAKEVATKRYIIAQDFYAQIVEPYFSGKPSNVSTKKGKIKNLENFDFVEMNLSDFDETIGADTTVDTTVDNTTPDTESALSGLFNSAVEGGSKGAKYGASIGTLLAGAGVPPPLSNLAGATAGAQLGAIVGGIVKFFKLGIAKVKEALSKTGTNVDDITSGLPVGSEELGTTKDFDFKKLLLPLTALAIIYFVVIKKN